MDTEEVKNAVREVFEEEFQSFYVDSETHYQHHQFVQGLISWMDDTRGTVRKTLIHALVWGLLSLLLFGFIFFGQEYFK